MAQHTIPATGTFCWYELASTDVEASKKFYTELLGWTLKEGQVPSPTVYHEITAGSEPVGGMYQADPADQGGAPQSRWTAYVSVEDVDDAARRVWELGGRVCVPPTDIPGVGRFCVVADPTGATISLITMGGSAS